MRQPSTAKLIIAQAESGDDIEAVRTLVREYTAWAFTIADEAAQAPTFFGLDEELASLPGMYAPPTGCLLLARYDGQPAGCVGLKGHDSMNCEVKRLYVRPDMRGFSIGWLLVEKVVEEAQRLGYRRIVLDTHISLAKALAIYEAFGFRRVAPPEDFPEQLKPISVFMERELAPDC